MFGKIFETGNKVFTKSLVLRFIKSPDDQYRMAFVIRKKVGNAVVRNRIRRIIRETLFAHSRSFNQNYWLLFNINNSAGSLTNDEIRSAVLKSLEKSTILNK